ADQLEGPADLPRSGHMRSAAEIEPLALPVNFERLSLGDCLYQLHLEVLALVCEEFPGLLPAPHLLGEGSIALDNLPHFCFYARQILRVKRLGLGEVVIEAVFDHRTDRDLGAGP